jgi:hypothetical protein
MSCKVSVVPSAGPPPVEGFFNGFVRVSTMLFLYHLFIGALPLQPSLMPCPNYLLPPVGDCPIGGTCKPLVGFISTTTLYAIHEGRLQSPKACLHPQLSTRGMLGFFCKQLVGVNSPIIPYPILEGNRTSAPRSAFTT